MPSAYQSRPYDDSDSRARMGDLLGQQGRIAAQSAQNRAAITSNTVSNVAGAVTRTMGDMLVNYNSMKEGQRADADRVRRVAREDRSDARDAKIDARTDAAAARADAERAQQTAAENALKASVDPVTRKVDYGKAARALADTDPARAEDFWQKANAETVREAQATKLKADEVSKGIGAAILTGRKDPESGARAYGAFRASALESGLIGEDDLPAEFDIPMLENELVRSMSVQQVITEVLEAAPEAKKHLVVTPGPNGRPVNKLVTEADLMAGVPIYEKPEKPSGGDVTRAQYNAAITARRADLQRLEAMKLENPEMPRGDWDRMIHEIESDFAAKTNAPPPEPPLGVDRLPERGTRSLAQGGPGTNGPTDGDSMADLFQQGPGPSGSPLGAGRANAAPAPPGPGMVRMQAPTGETAWVPQARVKDAIAKGAKVVR